MIRFIKKYVYELLALAGTVAVLGGMLLPGYILTLDLVWVPHMPLVWDTNGINNAYPVFAFFHFLSLLLPGWVGEKVMLVTLFFLLFYIPLRWLPLVTGTTARVFAAAVFALNPFVYGRMLAGQWLVLFGYALLPLFFAVLLRCIATPSKKHAVQLGLVLALVGVFGIHFLYLCLLVTGVCLVVLAISHVVKHTHVDAKKTFAFIAYIVVPFVVLSAYWLVPALLRQTPIEARFTPSDYAAFAAAPNVYTPTMLNVLALGGYWGEATAWSLYFYWPQAQLFFWIAAGLLWALVLVGLVTMLTSKKMRSTGVLLVLVGVMAYITALGAGDTVFKTVNVFLYNHMPLWSGLRDSQKIAGLLAVVYAVCAGVGVGALQRLLPSKKYIQVVFGACVLTIPALFGMYEWGGFNGQLQPVWYPAEWYDVQAVLQAIPPTQKVLVLPWHGYTSLEFNHQLVTANPGPAFFGYDKVIASRSIDAGDLHDTEVDPQYRALDNLLTEYIAPDKAYVVSQLKRAGIAYVVFIRNKSTPAEANWTDNADTIAYTFGSEATLDNTIVLIDLAKTGDAGTM